MSLDKIATCGVCGEESECPHCNKKEEQTLQQKRHLIEKIETIEGLLYSALDELEGGYFLGKSLQTFDERMYELKDELGINRICSGECEDEDYFSTPFCPECGKPTVEEE